MNTDCAIDFLMFCALVIAGSFTLLVSAGAAIGAVQMWKRSKR